ncbi:hypothetical protein JOF56_004694 [Kibdelosporangium banguiense]|uniref:Uncharacterized protein n=1 Tax=Kibdelosporangium banguiense TaxID=1365924 RepID=A0ABS4TJY0_9PSEU|nr:hypothetical protein [Kibdelosporangium banguiense]MBP2324309.1 hypothetical protein [Kibdelosporangium banguiense]
MDENLPSAPANPRPTGTPYRFKVRSLTTINDHVFVAATVGQRIYHPSSNLVDQSQGTYNRLRTVEAVNQGDIWPTTTTGNDRIPHIDIVYSSS